VSADFQIIWRRFTHTGSDAEYLSLLSVSVTANKCDCNFSVKIKVLLNFKIKLCAHFYNSIKLTNFVFFSIKKIRLLDPTRQCHRHHRLQITATDIAANQVA